MRSLTDTWVVNICLHLILHHTENMKFHLEQHQLKHIENITALQSPLLSQAGTILGTESIPYFFKSV